MFINLTPHEIHEVKSDTVLPKAAVPCRISATSIVLEEIDGVTIFGTNFGDIEGLPEPQEGVIYVVSALCLNAVPTDRTDVVAPGNACRDKDGRVIGCLGFRRK